jgi:hypothetical protein
MARWFFVVRSFGFATPTPHTAHKLSTPNTSNMAIFQRSSPAEKDEARTASMDMSNEADEANDVSLNAQTRTRKLFSFAQLFAFSLTYMGVWEGMTT